MHVEVSQKCAVCLERCLEGAVRAGRGVAGLGNLVIVTMYVEKYDCTVAI